MCVALEALDLTRCSGCSTGKLPELEIGLLLYCILGAAVGLKIFLYLYCVALKGKSDSMMALAEVSSPTLHLRFCTAFTA